MITVTKQGVDCTFVEHDAPTDTFVRSIYPEWEPHTFEVFDRVRKELGGNGIAIDLGAWIGTTAIWLAKKFEHVVAVECDPVSVECLRRNLRASNVENVFLVPYAIAEETGKVVFGPRAGHLINSSVSHIKRMSESSMDVTADAMTFAQLLQNVVEHLNRPVRFIKMDIEGGEETVLPQVFQYAYAADAYLYVSFHLDFWSNDKDARMALLDPWFEKFHVVSMDGPRYGKYGVADTPISGESTRALVKLFLSKEPFGSILFRSRFPDEGTEASKRLQKAPVFDYKAYWERNYVQGGNSGSGSYGLLAGYKADVVTKLLKEYNIRTVAEIGCGDGNQLGLIPYPSYVGYDVSATAVERCLALHPHRHFEVYEPGRTAVALADATVCLDVLYHITSDEDYDATVRDLFECAEKLVILYTRVTGDSEPKIVETIHDRDIKKAVLRLASPEWRLVSELEHPLPKLSSARFLVWARP